jgi:hypothetical protein
MVTEKTAKNRKKGPLALKYFIILKHFSANG